MNKSPLEDLIPMPQFIQVISDIAYKPSRDLAVLLDRPLGNTYIKSEFGIIDDL